MNTLQHQLPIILQWVVLKNPWTINTTVIWITMKNGCLAIQVSRLWSLMTQNYHHVIYLKWCSNYYYVIIQWLQRHAIAVFTHFLHWKLYIFDCKFHCNKEVQCYNWGGAMDYRPTRWCCLTEKVLLHDQDTHLYIFSIVYFLYCDTMDGCLQLQILTDNWNCYIKFREWPIEISSLLPFGNKWKMVHTMVCPAIIVNTG